MPADTTRELIPDEIETTDKDEAAPKGRVASVLSGLKRRPWLISTRWSPSSIAGPSSANYPARSR